MSGCGNVRGWDCGMWYVGFGMRPMAGGAVGDGGALKE